MYRGILIALCAVLTISSCKSNDDKPVVDEASKLNKQEFAAEKNVVDTIILKRQVFNRELLSNGKLSSLQKSDIRFGTSGEIVELNVNNGDVVSKGDVLARLADDDIRINLEKSNITLAKSELEMKDYLIGQGYSIDNMSSIPEKVLSIAKIRSGYADATSEISRLESELKQRVLVAPFSGKIANLEANINEQTSDKFCTVINDGQLEVLFSVLESEIDMISIGDRVSVMPFYDSKQRISAKLIEINPIVDKNGLIQIKARLTNNGKLYDGMNVKVVVQKPLAGQLVVPKSAVVIRDNLEVLFVYKPDGTAVWTYVHVEKSNTTQHVVVPNVDRSSELSEGDAVIYKGNLNLADGSQVEIRQ